MVKEDWGMKRVCQHCSARFYDLRRSPIICPKCKHSFDPDLLLKAKRSRATASAAPLAVAKDTAEVPLFDVLVDDEMSLTIGSGNGEADDVLIEDPSDLGGEEDMQDVIDRRAEEEGI